MKVGQSDDDDRERAEVGAWHWVGLSSLTVLLVTGYSVQCRLLS